MHYFKFNIADWHLATRHLSLEEEAIYFRLITHYYDIEQPIPLETQPVIRRLCLGSHIETVEVILGEFFEKTEKGFVHNRIEKELKEYRKGVKKNRANGAKGGRPRKDAACSETQTKPTGLFLGTQTEPKHNPNHKPLTTNQEPVKDSSPPAAPVFNFKKALLDLGVSDQAVTTWLAVRRKKKATNSELALKGILSEVQKAGISVAQAIEISATNSWSGFKNEWYRNAGGDGGNGGPASTKQTSIIDDLTNTDWATGGEETPIEHDARSGHTLENIK